MQRFKLQISVTKDDLDDLNHVNNVRYVDWVNQIAKAHWLSKASETLLKNYFWVLLSHHIEYKSAAFLNDEITLSTYITKAEGVTSTRIVEIHNTTTNKLLAKSETNWCFINAKTNKPNRITPEIEALL